MKFYKKNSLKIINMFGFKFVLSFDILLHLLLSCCFSLFHLSVCLYRLYLLFEILPKGKKWAKICSGLLKNRLVNTYSDFCKTPFQTFISDQN